MKEEILYYGKKLLEKGLVVGPGGNISLREDEVIYLTPSGLSFEEMEEEDLVAVEISSGKVVEGKRRPTSEIELHLACYREREDIRAVIHTHPSLSTGWVSGGGKLFPPFPDFVAYVGKKIAILPYQKPATPQMGKEVGKAVKDVNAVILINHGLVTVGRNLKEAYYRTLLIEESAKFIIASHLGGKVSFLKNSDIEELDKFEVEEFRRKILQE